MPVTRRPLLWLSVGAGFSRPIAALAQAVTPLDITKNVCTLTCSQTLGPCYYAANLIRRDITEGELGLPTLLSFLVVDADTCAPIENAAIDIWHTNAGGVYSAPINPMCNPGDALARTKTFTRGIQMTYSSGWAHFNSIFPGWYSSCKLFVAPESRHHQQQRRRHRWQRQPGVAVSLHDKIDQ
jgi:protocatechuate 3,4-dioxygenase beta subunit